MDRLRSRGYVTAWHGAKWEGVAAIIREGRLRNSGPGREGTRTLTDGIGVYGFEWRDRVGLYSSDVSLGCDRVWWRPVLELLVDQQHTVKPRNKTDQLIIHEDGVVVVALWVEGLRSEGTSDGVPIRRWDPWIEAAGGEHAVGGQLATRDGVADHNDGRDGRGDDPLTTGDSPSDHTKVSDGRVICVLCGDVDCGPVGGRTDHLQSRRHRKALGRRSRGTTRGDSDRDTADTGRSSGKVRSSRASSGTDAGPTDRPNKSGGLVAQMRTGPKRQRFAERICSGGHPVIWRLVPDEDWHCAACGRRLHAEAAAECTDCGLIWCPSCAGGLRPAAPGHVDADEVAERAVATDGSSDDGACGLADAPLRARAKMRLFLALVDGRGVRVQVPRGLSPALLGNLMWRWGQPFRDTLTMRARVGDGIQDLQAGVALGSQIGDHDTIWIGGGLGLELAACRWVSTDGAVRP